AGDLGDQAGAEVLLQLPDLAAVEIVAVEGQRGGIEPLPLHFLVAAAGSLPDERPIGEERQPLVTLRGLPDPLDAECRGRRCRRRARGGKESRQEGEPGRQEASARAAATANRSSSSGAIRPSRTASSVAARAPPNPGPAGTPPSAPPRPPSPT